MVWADERAIEGPPTRSHASFPAHSKIPTDQFRTSVWLAAHLKSPERRIELKETVRVSFLVQIRCLLLLYIDDVIDPLMWLGDLSSLHGNCAKFEVPVSGPPVLIGLTSCRQ